MKQPEVVLAAGVFLYREMAGQVEYLLLLSTLTNEWGFPKGHGEPGEDARTTARREMEEESGVTKIEWQDFTGDLIYPVRGKTKRVTYFLAGTSEDSDVRLSSEHSEYCWVSPEKVQELIPHQNLVEIFIQAEKSRV